MEKNMKIVLVLFIMMIMGEAKDDQENIVMEMNERLALMEEQLFKTQDDFEKNQEELKKTQMGQKKTQAELLELRTKNIQLEERIRMNEYDQSSVKNDLISTKYDLAATKDELTTSKDDLIATKDDLIATIYDLAATKYDLTCTKKDLQIKDNQLEREVSFLENPPFFHACGFQNGLSSISQTISYSSLLYSSTNTEGGDLDISSGVFACPYPGSWTITWSFVAEDNAVNRALQVFLRKNGQNIQESFLYVYGYGGRTLVLHLDRGDTLDLYCEDCSAGIYRTTFCVSLSTFDE